MCVCLAAVSCDFFNASLPEFLEEYTHNVAAERYVLGDSYPRNAAGIECVPSGEPVTGMIRLRNPQRYEIEAEALVTVGGASPLSAYSNVDPDTKDIVTVQFGPLSDADEGELILIDVRLRRADGLREFEPYAVILKCNTVPSVPIPVNYDGSVYTRAEGAPWVPAADGNLYWTYVPAGGIHDDVTEFIVNGEKRPKAGWNERTGAIGGDTVLLYSVPAGGNASVSVKAVDTDMLESPALNTGTVMYKVIYDSNGGNGTTPPETTYSPGAAVTVDFAPAPVRTGYVFGGWKDNRDKTSADYVPGTAAKFSMPAADVTLYAHWVPTTEYYVSSVGNDISGDGTTSKPYATIKKAVETATTDDITVWVMTDIDINQSVTISGDKTVRLKASGGDRTVTRDVDAAVDFRDSFFKVNGTLILGDSTGSNLTFKGHVMVTYSPLVEVDGGSFEMNANSMLTYNLSSDGGAVNVNGGTFTMNGGEISGNNATAYDSYGGGVYVGNDSTFTMNGGTINEVNIANNGGGVYVDMNAAFEMNGGTISDNAVYSNGDGVYVYYMNATFEMSGDAVIENNNPVYLEAGSVTITVDDRDFTGSATIDSAPYTSPGTAVITGTAVSDVYGRFSLTGTSWVINRDGKTASP